MPRGNAGYIGAKQTPNSAATAAIGIFKMSEAQQLLSAGLYGTGTVPGTVVKTFMATANWTVPAGVTAVEVLMIAGGGGGGNTMGGGGGAGGYV